MITTNYSKSDWYRFIATFVIKMIPSILFVIAITFIILPVMLDGLTLMLYYIYSDLYEGFELWVEANNLNYSNTMPYHAFVSLMFLGGSTILIFVSMSFMKWFPSNYIVRKLGIEPRMKLVIFWKGKPRFQEK